MRKGIILAGGLATRLRPITNIISKQLLPVYDKPMIYYPLSILMLSNIKDIMIISTPEHINIYKKLLGNGSKLGIKICFETQRKPSGITEALIIADKFLDNQPSVLILGDNIFFGSKLTQLLIKTNKSKDNTIFLYPVSNPKDFGVAYLRKKKIIKIIEKPKDNFSNLAITGLYFFDKNAPKIARKCKPSNRGELEITDLLKTYLRKKKLNYEILGRGFSWLDTGTFDRLIEASFFVKTIQEQQGFYISCIEEIALKNKWVAKNKVLRDCKSYKNSKYYEYVKKLCL